MQYNKAMSRILLIPLIGVFGVCIYFVATGMTNTSAGKLAVHFIDVGYGNSALIEFPNGKNMLIDTGEEKTGRSVIDCLKNNRVKKIDSIVISHNHPDHTGALETIISQYQVDRIIKTSETVSGYGEVKVNILSARNSNELNDSSIVLKVSYKNRSFLLTSDIGNTICEELVKDHRREINSDIVSIPHHGKSSTLNFTKAVSPKVAVVSTGESQWGGPDDNILTMYKEQGAAILRTDKSGTITILTDGENLWY
jgi:competence protein ComEC